LIAELDHVAPGGLRSDRRFEFGDACQQGRRFCFGIVRDGLRCNRIVGSMPTPDRL
jgi:hypothetical protein